MRRVAGRRAGACSRSWLGLRRARRLRHRPRRPDPRPCRRPDAAASADPPTAAAAHRGRPVPTRRRRRRSRSAAAGTRRRCPSRRRARAPRLGAALADPALGPVPGSSCATPSPGSTCSTSTRTRPRIAGLDRQAAHRARRRRPRSTRPTRRCRPRWCRAPRPARSSSSPAATPCWPAGAGDPRAVEGRAGLGDLAGQVAAALQAAGTPTVTLRLDTTYAAGPRWAPGWSPADVAAGYTGGVSMLGLAGERAVRPDQPAPRDPGRPSAAAFVAALKAPGDHGDAGPSDLARPRAGGRRRARHGRRSAPVGDVLALALDDSDNALDRGSGPAGDGRRPAAPPTFPAARGVRQEDGDRRSGVDLTGVTLGTPAGCPPARTVPAPALVRRARSSAPTARSPAMQDTDRRAAGRRAERHAARPVPRPRHPRRRPGSPGPRPAR